MLASSGTPGHSFGKGAEHLGGIERFGENRVGAGFHVKSRAGDRAVQALAGGRVRARDHDEIAARFRGGGDLGGHVMGVGQFLVVEMAAFLGQQLILEMNGAGAGFLEDADHMHDVERFAITGVAVHQQRQGRGADNLADEERDFIDGDDAEVRQSHRCRHGSAGQIERLEARRPRLKRRHAVMRAWQAQDAGPLQQRAKAAAGGLMRKIRCDEIGHSRSPYAARIGEGGCSRASIGMKARFSGPT